MQQTNRRAFLSTTGSAFAALVTSGCMARSGSFVSASAASSVTAPAYAPLRPDPAGLLDLANGYSYKVISTLGEAMADGMTVPDRADGMGCFALADGKWALVRNHELQAHNDAGGTLPIGYDSKSDGSILPGGTTTLIVDPATLTVEQEYRSLAGTIRNCAGGITPWGSWLSCEENVTRAGDGVGQDHGWVFEVPAAAKTMAKPVPLKAMGRFNHEAAAVDPATGIVYLTEDRDDGLLYRFLPSVLGDLKQGGKLQALAIGDVADTRNWGRQGLAVGNPQSVRWIDLDNVESPEDDLRKRGALKGATLFARGEGIHMGRGELYFCCTSGGAAKLGQIFRLTPSRGDADSLELFFESTSPDQFNYGDNLTVGPNGHLIVCEDQYTDVVDNHLRAITPDGTAYALGRLKLQTELAGACFSPDGKVLFVNAYSPTKTFAITGPWMG
ncbi:MAG: alkaline phosphatase PhoX [Pseudomonadota bacterium]